LILKKYNLISKKRKMNAIPEEFQIKTLLNQDTYLVEWVKKMGRSNISVLNDFFRKYEPTILGSIPFMGEKEGWRHSCR
jgi:glyceraldehyde-3-phosphate dehydrogenase (NADP+)